MGLFTVAEKSDDKAKNEVQSFLLEGENVTELYSLVTDYCAVTNRRLIFVNKEFTSSNKVITSVPFSKITAVHMEKGGFMKFMKEITVTVGSKDWSIKLMSKENTLDLYNLIVSEIV